MHNTPYPATQFRVHSPYSAQVLPQGAPAQYPQYPDYVPTGLPTPLPLNLKPVVHQALHGCCPYIQIPKGLTEIVFEDTVRVSGILANNAPLPRPLFIGQVRFETTAGELLWLMQHVCGVFPLKIEPRGPGCFVAVVATSEESAVLQSFNRRFLFDYTGVWLATNEEELRFMESHVLQHGPFLSRRSHLPRDRIMIEQQKGSLDPLRTFKKGAESMQTNTKLLLPSDAESFRDVNAANESSACSTIGNDSQDFGGMSASDQSANE